MITKRIALASSAFLVALGVGQVQAATINVAVSGTCAVACANVGLATGASFSGAVQVDDAAFSPDSVTSGISSYSFSFGSFAMSNEDEAISNNLVEWGGTRGSVKTVYIFAFASDDLARPASYLSLAADTVGRSDLSYAANDAVWHVGSDGFFDGTEGNGALLSTGPIAVAPVPLPPAGLLLVGSLAGLAGLRLRRRAGEAA